MLTALVAGLSAWFSVSGSLQRVDHLIYDTLLVGQDHHGHGDVVILAIDDDSLQQLGRWPWSRQRHAELLDRLTAAGAKAVGFDVLFAEPQRDDPAADAAFAAALQRSGRAVLAVAPSKPSDGALITEILPLPILATNAAALGHVDIDTDGLSRSFFTHGGLGNPHWPAFAIALLEVGGDSFTVDAQQNRALSGEGWVRSGRYFVPYDPRPQVIETLSIARFLADPALSERVRDRYVLVGSTATGLGDVVSTPVSYDRQRMPGVTLNAHILNGLLNGGVARAFDDTQQIALSVAIAVAGGLLLVLTGFPWAALLVPLVIISAVVISAWMLVGWQLWFAPAAAIAPLIIAFPLWGLWSLVQEKRLNRALTVRMQHQAMHHAATGLPNEYRLEQRLRELDADSPPALAALMILHIARSGAAGGLIGQPSDDALLQSVAQRLDQVIRSGDLIVHLNGDDFALLVERLSSRRMAMSIGQQVLETVRQPHRLGDTTVLLTPRLGISLWPSDGREPAALLRNAYVAMFRARVEESEEPCAYSADFAREVEVHSQLEQALLSALDRGEFEVYYQPQVNSGEGRCVGVEALLRWHNPDLGLVYPGTFIPVAEHNGLIREIGSWVLNTACRQVQAWNAAGLGPLRLAVNLSPLQIADAGLLATVQRALATSGLSPATLELEVTEGAVMQNLEQACTTMNALKELGVLLAIDDFGTGYSSLSYLQRFPFDRIKIDRSFTSGIHSHADVREITRTIISMAKRLRRAVIAEGVENQAQSDFLRQHGCDELQGFLFGHPLPANEVVELLGEQRSLGPRNVPGE